MCGRTHLFHTSSYTYSVPPRPKGDGAIARCVFVDAKVVFRVKQVLHHAPVLDNSARPDVHRVDIVQARNLLKNGGEKEERNVA